MANSFVCQLKHAYLILKECICILGIIKPLFKIRKKRTATCANTCLSHQGFQVQIMWLSNYPVGIPRKCPAGDGPNQSLAVRQTANKVRHQFW